MLIVTVRAQPSRYPDDVWRLGIVAALAGCSTTGETDIVGPFHGTPHRFIVDRFDLPRDFTAFADDLDGDGHVENRLGALIAAIPAGDITQASADMIASGALASFVEIAADDLVNYRPVAVRYFGTDGDDPTPAAGAFVDGALQSNRTSTTRHPGRASVRLPVFADADPLSLVIEGMEIDLNPDGRGGYEATIRGGINPDAAYAATQAGLVQMFATRPGDHLYLARLIDRDDDGTCTSGEINSSIVPSLVLQADLQLFRRPNEYDPSCELCAEDSLSAGFRVHLSPCEAGNCAITNTPSCSNRVLDGMETDLDCGGSCPPCAAASRCLIATDCESMACDSGRCRQPSCSDGQRDGFESDVDCGGPCVVCALGQRCAVSNDCASKRCGDTGRCTL